ncbi:aminotransferase class V-fold PLP-dependent enzyme [Thermostilla marina]
MNQANHHARLRRFRDEMTVARKFAYFDHAAVAPLPQRAVEGITRWLREAHECGDLHWPRWAEEVEDLRDAAARLIGAARDEIALIRNTSHGIGLVAEGFPWKPGDNVVILSDEFPSNVYPWMNLADRGVETRLVPLDNTFSLEQLLESCNERTRIVSISWVNYLTGRRHDLGSIGEALHRRGILFFVDAIQGLGVFPLDVHDLPIDFLASDGHKWMLGPEGAGFFYCKQEHLDRLHPIGVGWNSVVHAFRFDHLEYRLKPTAERFEGGSQNMVGMIGLKGSLGLLLEVGIEHIRDAVLEATETACEALRRVGAEILSDRSPEVASGIVAFRFPDCDHQRLRASCLAEGVVLSCRGPGLRISPHGYCTKEDIERLVEVLQRAIACDDSPTGSPGVIE